ncbi:MATE efflux family protein LAL5 [Acorus calamus]|uniref:MATE efflux family protein LAL5 n=1 Tax=Acorus calamus TaxID=4465 RepID=A0AAV9FSK8_ACOCL|nr:MATE efflux family protein LAL5 [Acorus calamus]
MVVEEGNPSSSMEHPLIGASSELGLIGKAEILIGEVKRQLYLAGPLIAVSVLQYSLQVISLMFVGHLGKLSLSGASMATSSASVTGFSLLLGMGSALDTLCGQAYGAKQYHMLCIQMQRAMFVLLLCSSPALEAKALLQRSPYLTGLRVSNELGAGHPQAAHIAFYAVLFIAIGEGIILGVTTILLRDVWGYLYSNEDEVVKYVAAMKPVLATSDFMDGIQCALSGAARGCGWQKMCSIINFGAYYVAGLPSAVLFAFVFHLGGKLLMLMAVIISTNWEQEARKAQDRVYGIIIPGETA